MAKNCMDEAMLVRGRPLATDFDAADAGGKSAQLRSEEGIIGWERSKKADSPRQGRQANLQRQNAKMGEVKMFLVIEGAQ